MKKTFLLLVICLLLCPLLAVAEETSVLDLDAAGLCLSTGAEVESYLSQNPDVQEVLLYNSTLPREDMERLFDTYPQVFFGFTIRFATHTVRTDATAFSTLHWANITDPRDRYHTSDELSILRLCTRLKALDLGHNKLTDLSFLSGLTDLRVLILSPNYSLRDLSPLAQLTKLEYLEAFSTDATEVTALAGLTELRDLNLSCSDMLRDITCLYGLPKLERFWCGETPIPAAQQRAMEESHPDCLCVWRGQPTTGGWRKHPRYDVIQQMFSGSQYIPFPD